MAKIFRNIRQGLFTNGRFSSYVVYAVGEIFLVVIGILIALAINNSNETRKMQEREQIYLAGLRDEFHISKMKLEELIRVNRKSYEDAIMIVELISQEGTMPSEKAFSELLFSSFAFDLAFNPNNSLLNEMISSGSLRELSDPELRIRLTNWISTLEDISKQERELAVQREKVLDMFRSGENSIRTILDMTGVTGDQIGIAPGREEISNLNLLRSREFENNVLLFILASQATETSHYLPLIREIDSILSQLKAGIEK